MCAPAPLLGLRGGVDLARLDEWLALTPPPVRTSRVSPALIHDTVALLRPCPHRPDLGLLSAQDLVQKGSRCIKRDHRRSPLANRTPGRQRGVGDQLAGDRLRSSF